MSKKNKATRCKFNANRTSSDLFLPFCTWSPPTDLKFPPTFAFRGHNGPSEEECSKCQCFKESQE